MSYLLDTNVISELIRSKPNNNVIHWFNSVPSEALHISVLTLGEIRKGVEQIKETVRKEKLRLWLENDLPQWFQKSILPIDIYVADRWGRLQVEMKQKLPIIDSLLAATALHFDLRLVTRNIQDFAYPNLTVINPWDYTNI